MNKTLVKSGIISTLLWGCVAAMSVGIPLSWCRVIDAATFSLLTDAVYKMNNGFYYETANADMPTVMFLAAFFAAFAVYMYTALRVEKRKAQRYSLAVVIGFAVLFRLILLPSQPVHENDFYRYLWDGKSANHLINPYKYAPSDVAMYDYGITQDYYDEYNDVTIKAREFSSPEEEELKVLMALRDNNPKVYDRIGHWQVPTIYPPVAQILFASQTAIKPDSYLGIKSMFLLFDLAVILVIIALLRHFAVNPCMSVIYAWSPLVLKEYANAGHYDPIPIFFTLLSVLLLVKHRHAGAVTALALAALSKFFSGILLPLYLRTVRQRFVMLFAGIFLAFYLPFVFWGQTGWGGVFEGLSAYNKHWSYNSSVFAAVYNLLDAMNPAWTDSYLPAKLICGLLFLGVLVYLYLKPQPRQIDVVHKCFAAIAALFIINPVGDPWYFGWAVPFLCLFPYRSWLLLSGLLMLSYLNFQESFFVVQTKVWNIPLVSWMIYGPFFVAFAAEMYLKRKKRAQEQGPPVGALKRPFPQRAGTGKKEEERETRPLASALK